MVTYCGTKMTYSTMIGQIFDTMSMASYTGGAFVLGSAGNCFSVIKFCTSQVSFLRFQ